MQELDRQLQIGSGVFSVSPLFDVYIRTYSVHTL